MKRLKLTSCVPTEIAVRFVVVANGLLTSLTHLMLYLSRTSFSLVCVCLFVCLYVWLQLQEDLLLKRVEALEKGVGFDATKEAVQQVQMEYLTKLREIRKAIANEEGGGGGGASSKELETLKAQNEALQKKNAKQAYRIQHLVHTVEELMAEQKQ